MWAKKGLVKIVSKYEKNFFAGVKFDCFVLCSLPYIFPFFLLIQ